LAKTSIRDASALGITPAAVVASTLADVANVAAFHDALQRIFAAAVDVIVAGVFPTDASPAPAS
jgi:hypothetical protein